MKEKETVRVSFDVPVEEHIFLKTECAKARIALRDLMQDVFHQTVEQLRKKQLKERLEKGVREAKKGKGRIISQEELDEWEKMVDDE
jgi:hypothetical protein